MSGQLESPWEGNSRNNLREALERADSLDELRDTFDRTSNRSDELSKDEIFEVLYNSRRRIVLTYLIAHEGAATVGEMAEHIAAVENDTTVQQISSYERKRVYVGLYQNHLPMMDDVGVLEYDKNRGTVQLSACATQLEPYLDLTDEPDTSRLIAGSALAFSGVPLLSVLDIASIGGLGVPLWVAVGAIGLFALALLDTYGSLG